MSLFATLRDAVHGLRQFATRGPRNRRTLADIEIRIAVTGIRGKTTTTTWLYEALAARGYDVYGKVTGEEPLSLHGGVTYPIERSGPVRLYETEAEIARFEPADAIVVENQGIREYTSRLVNRVYVDPTLVVLTNVRRDHVDSLGPDLRAIARSLVRSVPAGTTVVCGERNEAMLEYLERQFERRDCRLVRAHAAPVGSPAEELLGVVDTALSELGLDPLTAGERQDFSDRLSVTWRTIPGGRVFHAAKVNDVESTDLVRRALSSAGDESITPLVYFRADRPGRTAGFIDYLNELVEAGLVTEIHCVGAHSAVATRRLAGDVVWHHETRETASAVLDAALANGSPVLTMGNGVPGFMQDLKREIETRRSAESVDTDADDEAVRNLA